MPPTAYDDDGNNLKQLRRRREDRHPLIALIIKSWIAISTMASVSMAAFLALGFEFKTPATWLSYTNQRISQIEIRQQEQTAQQLETNRLLRIMARDVCSRFTREQLRVTPDCDPYVQQRTR